MQKIIALLVLVMVLPLAACGKKAYEKITVTVIAAQYGDKTADWWKGFEASMLRQAGFGVAMGNAPAFIRDIADAVTERSDLDGAAIAIEQYVLMDA